MDFPSYVPSAVRVRVAAMLEGEGRKFKGLLSTLTLAEADLQRIQRAFDERVRDDVEANGLRIQRKELTERCAHLTADIECLKRLVHDARMQTPYALLISLPNVTELQLSGFIDAAWAAHMDYAKFRERVKVADEIAREVAKAAGELADVLRKAESLGDFYPPCDFMSIHALLAKTEHDSSNRNYWMWHGMRKVITGERPPSHAAADLDTESSEKAEPSEIEDRFAAKGEGKPTDPVEAARSALGYAWQTAPNMARIITTLQHEAEFYKASESGHIGEALISRKRNRKFEYLRAFGTLLSDEHHLDLTTGTMNAMAITATVVLNQADLDVSYDDVRKALANIAR